MEYLITVFHNAKKKKLEIAQLLEENDFKNSFAKNGELVKLPDSLFIKKTSGIDPKYIRDRELKKLDVALSSVGEGLCSLGVFVGEDWTQTVAS